MNQLNKSVENILKYILVFPAFATSVIYFYIENKFLFLIPTLSYLGWIYYVCFIKVESNLSYSKERIYLERMRGVSYIISLLITIIFNFIYFVYIPNFLVSIFVLIIIYVGLITALFLTEWFFFRFGHHLLTRENKIAIYNILKEVGVSSIYYSFIINTIIFSKFIINQILIQLVVNLFVQIFFLYQFYRADHKSIEQSNGLAEDLAKKNFYLRYQKILRKNRS